MTKRLLALLTASLMMVSAGCRSASAPAASSSAAPSSSAATDTASSEVATETPAGDYKIGIMTGTVSQGEEEFRAAEQMKAKYGDKIITATYPDNFTTETETVISNTVALASDPAVKAIVFVQAVPGTSAAIDKVRETRPDMLFIAGVAAEDPRTIASKSDIVFLVDEISMGTTIPTQAQKQGAKTLIHYSFARHLSYATIAARHDLMKEKCAELGIEFVDVNAPDPTGDAGVAGAQQFIVEDVPRQVAKYGKDTAFFSTNCAMQEPLIRGVLKEGAILPQQCCPSPYHAYPGALGISTEGHEGDVPYMLDQIAAKVKESGNEGRMSTWGVPVNMLMVEAGVEYAMAFAEGKTNGRLDETVLLEKMNAVAPCTITKFKDDAGEIPNFFMILSNFIDF